MTIQDVGITFLIAAVIGCYAYVQRAVDDMRKRQQKTEDGIEKALKEYSKVVQALTVQVARLEERVGMALAALKKGVSGESI